MKLNWKFWQKSAYVTPNESGWTGKVGKGIGMAAGALVGIYVLVVIALWWWWSYEPDMFDPVAIAKERAAKAGVEPVIGLYHGDHHRRASRDAAQQARRLPVQRRLPARRDRRQRAELGVRSARPPARHQPGAAQRPEPLPEPVRRGSRPCHRPGPLLLRQRKLDLPRLRKRIPQGRRPRHRLRLAAGQPRCRRHAVLCPGRQPGALAPGGGNPPRRHLPAALPECRQETAPSRPCRRSRRHPGNGYPPGHAEEDKLVRDRRRLLRGARPDLGARASAQGRGPRLRRRSRRQERPGEPAPDHPRTGGHPGGDLEPDDPERRGASASSPITRW